jgi:integrase
MKQGITVFITLTKTLMSIKGSKTTCSGLEWNEMIGLLTQLKKDKYWKEFLLITIGSYLGLRGSDILNLKWDDLVDKTKLQLREKKTGNIRFISINEQCVENISLAWSSKKQEQELEDYIFTNKRRKRISIQYMNRRLKWIFEKYRVKTDNPSTHTLRKTFGKRVYEVNDKSESSLIMLSLVFSHSSLAITRRYLGITQEQIQDVYLSL